MNTYTTSKVVSDAFELSIQRENDLGYLVPLPIWVHSGGYFVEGIPGRRYTIDVRNYRSRTRTEFVVSVDGIDIHDGQDGDEKKSGLVVPGGGRWSFTGYRTSMKTVATFRFCAPDGSYAALTGRPKSVGVIGVAAYDEKEKESFIPYLASLPFDDTPWRPRTPYPSPPPRLESDGTKSMSMSSTSAKRVSQSQSIGTQYGEQRESLVSSTKFDRRTISPNSIVTIRYETADVLEQMGIPVSTHQYAVPERGPDPFPAGSHSFVPPPPSWKAYHENIF